MVTVADAVYKLVQTDNFAKDGIENGLLNLSAYAKQIHKQIEQQTFKKVNRGTIIVALCRIAKTVEKAPHSLPNISFSNLSVKSSLAALTFIKTPDIQRKIAVLHPFNLPAQDIFSITEGPSEITIIFSMPLLEKLKKHFKVTAKEHAEDLVAITVVLQEELRAEPNAYYAILSLLSGRKISLVAFVTTATEASFVIKKEDMEKTVGALGPYFTKRK